MAVTPKMIIEERKVVEKQRKDSLIQAATDHIDHLLREKFTIVAQPVNLSNDELGKPVIDANKYWDEIATTYQSSGWKVEDISGGYRFTAQSDQPEQSPDED